MDNPNTLPPAAESQGMQQWGRKPVEDFREVVLRGIEKCRIEGSKQMVEGIEEVWIKNPDTKQLDRIQLFDQKQVFRESVETLYDLMLFYFDEEIKEKLKEIEKDLQNKRKECFDNFLKEEVNVKAKNQARYFNVIPSSSPAGKKYQNQFKGEQDKKTRKMFRELLLLYKRKNDLRSKSRINPFD